MKLLIGALTLAMCVGALATVVAAERIIILPPGIESVPPGDGGRVPCDIQLRYDDGTDDSPGHGPALGWYSTTEYQYLGIRFTPPPDRPYFVQSASWYSDFWFVPGNVDVEAQEWDNPANTTSATIYVTGAGTWEVEFANPICIPRGGDYFIMLCPQPYATGMVGDDYSDPFDQRSYFTGTPSGCFPEEDAWPNRWMIWSCVTPCGPPPATGACCIGEQGYCAVLTADECSAQNGRYAGDGTTCEPNPCEPTPTEAMTWGHVKSMYR